MAGSLAAPLERDLSGNFTMLPTLNLRHQRDDWTCRYHSFYQMWRVDEVGPQSTIANLIHHEMPDSFPEVVWAVLRASRAWKGGPRVKVGNGLKEALRKHDRIAIRQHLAAFVAKYA